MGYVHLQQKMVMLLKNITPQLEIMWFSQKMTLSFFYSSDKKIFDFFIGSISICGWRKIRIFYAS